MDPLVVPYSSNSTPITRTTVLRIIVRDVEFGLTDAQLRLSEPYNLFYHWLRKYQRVQKSRRVYIGGHPEIFPLIQKHLSGGDAFPILEDTAQALGHSRRTLVRWILEDAARYRMYNLAELAMNELKAMDDLNPTPSEAYPEADTADTCSPAQQPVESELYKLERTKLQHKRECLALDHEYQIAKLEAEACKRKLKVEKECSAKILDAEIVRDKALIKAIAGQLWAKKSIWNCFKPSTITDLPHWPSLCLHSSCACYSANTVMEPSRRELLAQQIDSEQPHAPAGVSALPAAFFDPARGSAGEILPSGQSPQPAGGNVHAAPAVTFAESTTYSTSAAHGVHRDIPLTFRPPLVQTATSPPSQALPARLNPSTTAEANGSSVSDPAFGIGLPQVILDTYQPTLSSPESPPRQALDKGKHRAKRSPDLLEAGVIPVENMSDSVLDRDTQQAIYNSRQPAHALQGPGQGNALSNLVVSTKFDAARGPDGRALPTPSDSELTMNTPAMNTRIPFKAPGATFYNSEHYAGLNRSRAPRPKPASASRALKRGRFRADAFFGTRAML